MKPRLSSHVLLITPCHCEERSDAAISWKHALPTRLLRFARNEKLFLLVSLLLLPLLLTGCELFGGDDEEPTITPLRGVVVANGGDFNEQNGSITVYNPHTGATVNLSDLGGFSQGLALRADRAYVMLNTFSTGHIDVLDMATSQPVAQIQNLPAPRYLGFVNDNKAYVTNFVFGSAGLVSVIDLTTHTEQGDPIAVGESPEGIVVVDDRAYVANYGNLGAGTTLSVIDTNTDTVVGTIDLGCDGPKDLLLDREEEIVVVCQGKTVYNADFTEILEQTNGQVLFVNPTSETVVDRIAFDRQLGSSNFTQAAYAAPDADEVYVIAGDDERVYRIDSQANTLDTELTLPDAPQHTGLTAVAYDAAAERLYLARFAQGAGGGPDVAAAGAVFVYDRAGNEMNQFAVGPSPSFILLVRE